MPGPGVSISTATGRRALVFTGDRSVELLDAILAEEYAGDDGEWASANRA
jgi:hypothetical protein